MMTMRTTTAAAGRRLISSLLGAFPRRLLPSIPQNGRRRINSSSSSSSSWTATNIIPSPEWIHPFLDVSDLVLSPTTYQHQLPRSPWLDRVIHLLLLDSSAVESRLDSFCARFLVKLSPAFVSQVLRSPHLPPQASLRFFRWAAMQKGYPGHNLHSYVSLVHILARSPPAPTSNDDDDHGHRLVTIIRELLGEIRLRRLPITCSASASLIKSLGAKGMVEELLLVWRLMKDSNGPPPSLLAYNCLLDALVHSMFIDSAAKVFNAMQAHPDVVTYNIMIKGYCRAGRTSLALDMFRAMTTHANSSSNDTIVAPDKITYTTLIQALYSDGDFDACFQLYHEMEEKGLEIPLHAYTLVIGALCKNAKALQARSVFDKMRSSGCKGSVAIYTALIDSFAKSGNEEQAMALFERMKAEGFEPDEVTHGVLINCLCKSGKLDKAIEWFHFCQRTGLKINAIVYSSLLDGFGKAGKVNEAENLFEEMVGKGCAPDAYCYNALIDAFCRAGKIDEAMSTFKRMETEGCDQTVYTYTILLDGLFRKHKNEEALRLWNMMIDKGITPTPASFRTLSTGLCLSGKVERACAILDDMAPMGVIPDTAHEDMIGVLCRAGRIQQACKLADETVDKGREIPAKVRTILINALRKAGKADLAIKLLHSKIGIGYDRFGSVKRRVKFQSLLSN